MTFVERVLGEGGSLSEAAPGRYEQRPQQLRMAEAAARALAEGGVLLVEAGTGTGKTLAYLTAAVASDRRVVVSTGTKNLQDQILRSDIPLLEKALGRELGAVCLKGLGNYLCLRRLDALSRTAPLLADADEALLLRVERWARETETGDRSELEDLPEGAPLWQEVCAQAETRLGPRCPFHEECFVTRARRAAGEARLIVVNHHLLFADLALREETAQVLPDYEALVLDEAHQIDSIATEFFGSRVSSRQLELLVGEVQRTLSAASREAAAKAEPVLGHVLTHSRAFFEMVTPRAAVGQGRSELSTDDVSGDAEACYWRLDAALEELSAHLSGLTLGEEAVTAGARRTDVLRAELSAIVGRERRAAVYWKESSRAGGAIGSSPVDVAEILREKVFYQVESVVLTSATLTAAGSFAYVRERLGIDFDAGELQLPSPFDFEEQTALFLPSDAPDPRRAGYAESIARFLEETCAVVPGGALALFTSYKVMYETAEIVRDSLPRTVRLQGERPRHALLEELRAAKAPLLLLATASFWEGVDVPGDGLQLVVITRLPFASPADPIVAARLRLLEEEGRSPFAEYQLPRAALTLKQGFGRLIRSRRDRGVVAVLDRRITSMSYGQTFLRSLPRCATAESVEELRRWWAGG